MAVKKRKKKSGGLLSSIEESIRSVTSKVAKPRTGKNATRGRKQRSSGARFDNSAAIGRRKKKR